MLSYFVCVCAFVTFVNSLPTFKYNFKYFQYFIMVEFYSKEEAKFPIRSLANFTASRNRNFRASFTSSRSKERNLATKMKCRLQFLVALRRFFPIRLSATNDKQNLSY